MYKFNNYKKRGGVMKKLKEVLENKQENYIFPLFWISGEEDEYLLREYMGKIYETGIRAVCVESRIHTDFMGEKWWRDMDVIMDEARKRRMKVWVIDDVHFPTGSANGKIISEHPDLMKKFLKIHQLDFVGPLKDASILVKWGSPGNRLSVDKKIEFINDKIIGIIAGRKTGENRIDSSTLRDVSSFEKNGVLYWDIPEGDWRIFILIETIYGGEKETEGYLNPLDPRAVEVLIKEVYEPYYDRYKNDFGKTFAGFFSDEPRFGNIHGSDGSIGRCDMVLPWRENLIDEFSKEEFLKLPLLLPIEADGEEYAIRYKYMDLVSRIYGETFTGTLASWCRSRGVEYIGHLIEDNNAHARLGYGTGHYFRGLWEQDMAGIDVVLNQIMPGMDKGYFKSMTSKGWDGEFFHYGLAKMGTSLGHLDPKKKNRTMCEVFGAYGWAEGIRLMKWITDHMLVRGVTHFVPHAFSPKPFPDPDCPPHFYANGNDPQFRFMHILFNYMNRMCHLLNNGKHIANTGLLYHAEAEWLGDYMLFQKPARELMQHQIDFDVISIDLICNARIECNQYYINNESFKALIIPYSEALPQKLLNKIKQLTEAGVLVLFVGGWPSRNEMGAKVGQEFLVHTKVVELDQLVDALYKNKIFDIKTSEKQPYLRYYHYQHPDGNIYMFFNEDPYKKIETQVTLGNDKHYVAYNGFSNKLEEIPQKVINGKTVISLKLDTYESVMIIEGTEDVAEKPLLNPSQIIDGQWNVSYSTAKSYPKFTSKMNLEKLQDISKLDGFTTFAGTIRYEIEFEITNVTENAVLDLGKVYEVAEVFLNGKHVGTKITPPFLFDVSDVLKKGRNILVIEVTNNLGKQEQDYLSQYMVLEPTGLLGPVRLLQ